jgi:hypothetical protein
LALADPADAALRDSYAGKGAAALAAVWGLVLCAVLIGVFGGPLLQPILARVGLAPKGGTYGGGTGGGAGMAGSVEGVDLATVGSVEALVVRLALVNQRQVEALAEAVGKLQKQVGQR